MIRITASHKYALWINGDIVGYGPARSWPKRKIYDEIDATAFLRKGVNHIAALVSFPVCLTGFSVQRGMGLFIQGIVRTDAETTEFCTDRTWKTLLADWMSSHLLRISIPTDDQEHFSGSHEPAGWQTGPCACD